MSILGEYYKPAVTAPGYVFDPSAIFTQLDPTESEFGDYMNYFRKLPINDKPDAFGLHDNADIAYANNQTMFLLNTLLALQPRSAAGGISREDVVSKLASEIEEQLPPVFDLESILKNYPVMYEESMNTVLQQEAERFNKLLKEMKSSLGQMQMAIKGLVVMSDALEKMFTSLFDNQVPGNWSRCAYPSLKPLGAWVKDLVERCQFIKNWVDNGTPAVFWISGFFFPQAFITGTLQNFARKVQVSIHTIGFDFAVLPGPLDEWQRIQKAPEDGCYIRGLFLEAAIWDVDKQQLAESRPKELYTDMAAMHLIPVPNRVPKTTGIYTCPIYKTITRAGTLSTTGHSTNFVMPVELPTDLNENHWIRRATALMCSLDY
ncbi:unnamed protein product [Oikopleura dioica]|nr:unnamed protein product [Oikopleura dioica]